jgi:hypothetical protein
VARCEWFQAPQDVTLGDRAAWHQVGKDKTLFAAGRAHILVVKRPTSEFKNGPVVLPIDLPVGAEATISEKHISVTKHSGSFTNSIAETVTEKVSYEETKSIGAEFSGGLNPVAKSMARSDSKLAEELSLSLQSQFSRTRSYEITNTEEIVRSLAIKPTGALASPLQKYNVHLKLKVHRWDVFLYRIETAQVKYRKRWVFKDIRDNAQSRATDVMWPLGQLVFYEPLSVPSIGGPDYTPDIHDGEQVEFVALSTEAPKGLSPRATAWQSLVRTAFPVSKEEKTHSKRVSRAVSREREKREFAWVPKPAAKRVGGRKKGGRRMASKAKERRAWGTTKPTASRAASGGARHAAKKKSAARATGRKSAMKASARKRHGRTISGARKGAGRVRTKGRNKVRRG